MPSSELEQLRINITELDTQLLTFLAKRQKYTNQVAETKIKNHIPVRDQKREEQLLIRLIKEGKKHIKTLI